jgi:hypothetical protein
MSKSQSERKGEKRLTSSNKVLPLSPPFPDNLSKWSPLFNHDKSIMCRYQALQLVDEVFGRC